VKVKFDGCRLIMATGCILWWADTKTLHKMFDIRVWTSAKNLKMCDQEAPWSFRNAMDPSAPILRGPASILLDLKNTRQVSETS